MRIFLLLSLLFLLVTSAAAETTAQRIQALEKRWGFAVSDYAYAMGFPSKEGCDRLVRESALRRMNKVMDELVRSMNVEQQNVMKMIHRYQEIVEELRPLLGIEDTNKLKKGAGGIAEALKTFAMGDELVEEGLEFAGDSIKVAQKAMAAFSLTKAIYDKAAEKARKREAHEVFDRLRTQHRAIEEAAARYQLYYQTYLNLAKRKASLARSWKKLCVEDRFASPGQDLGSQHQRGEVKVSLKGRGRPSGHIFDGHVQNRENRLKTIVIWAGTKILPSDGIGQRMVVTQTIRIELPEMGEVRFPIEGFCLDPWEDPPMEEFEYFLCPPERLPKPELLKTPGPWPYWNYVEDVPAVVREMLEDGRLPRSGLPPEMEFLTLTQWSIWSEFEAFNPEDGAKRIEEQVGEEVPPEMKRKLNENIWANVDLVKKEVRQRREGR